ncbi:putative methyltransferase [Virus Rctr85]|nr:putative methyltransferase [Virus Rctr85]
MSNQIVGNSLIRVGEDTPLPERDSNDFYPTPWSVIEAALQYAPTGPGLTVADIGAGSGRWGQVFKATRRNPNVVGFEKQNIPPHPDYYKWITGDVLDTLKDYGHHYYHFNAIFGNPPFYLYSTKYVRQFFDALYNALWVGGRLVLFGRSAIAESAARYRAVFSSWKPLYEIVCVDRVSFYVEGHPRCGDSNATAHSIFVWERGLDGPTEKLWLKGADNDDKYTGQFKGQNTWQDMIQLGLVKE